MDQAFDGERGNAKAVSGSSHVLCCAKKGVRRRQCCIYSLERPSPPG